MMKSILITGCSSGIGYATAKQLYHLGWMVFASCRQQQDVERLCQEGLKGLLLDVNDDESIRGAFEQVLRQTGGRLDAVFCNAGYGQPGAVEDVSRPALRQQYETNVFGTWSCVREAMRIFRRQGYGRIVVNSSVLGFAAMPWRGAYNSSKFALEGMCDTLRQEVMGSAIQVVLVEPGPIATRFREHALEHFRQHIVVDESVHCSAYQQQIERMQTVDKPGGWTWSADACAKICVDAICTTRPKLRYRITAPTRIFWYLKRVLPTILLDKILHRAGSS